MRKLVAGSSEHSFGIHVAKMAGIPKNVLDKANDMLKQEQDLYANFRNIAFEWMQARGYQDDWNSFVEEKQNAVQKQETESVPVRDEPEGSKGVREEDAEEQETTK